MSLASEPPGPEPQGDIDAVCGMVTGAPFDMTLDGERIVGEATDSLLTKRRGGGLRPPGGR